jgi:hypothetical protein
MVAVVSTYKFSVAIEILGAPPLEQVGAATTVP